MNISQRDGKVKLKAGVSGPMFPLESWGDTTLYYALNQDPDSGKDFRQEENGVTDNETFGWHHQLNGHKFEKTPGGSEGQGNLASCSPWGSQRVGPS